MGCRATEEGNIYSNQSLFSLNITHQRMHKLYIYISLKFITLKHLKWSYMFRSFSAEGYVQSTYPQALKTTHTQTHDMLPHH